jgi:hypothetical protein
MPLENLVRADLESRGMLMVAKTGLALERYRLAHGRWPEKLGELVPGFLPAIPLDPFDEAPLGYRQEGGEVMVYSRGGQTAGLGQGIDGDLTFRIRR